VHPSPDASHKNQPKVANGPAHTSIPLHVYKPRHSITLARARALPILLSDHPLTRRSGAVPVRPYPCAAIHQHRRTGQQQLIAPGTSRRLLPCDTSARQLYNGSSHHQASVVARRQRQLTARTTDRTIGRRQSALGTRHRSAPAVDFPFCSTRRRSAAPRSNFSDKEHHRAEHPLLISSTSLPLFLSRLAACLFLFRLCCL
jgi:hypothetical protein